MSPMQVAKALAFFAACSIIFILVLMAPLVGSSDKCEAKPQQSKIKPSVILGLEEVLVDGCQYLKVQCHGGYTLTHKGNCSNHIWRVKHGTE